MFFCDFVNLCILLGNRKAVMKRVNEKIKQLRLARGYTLENLATLCGLTKGYLSKIERSDNSPPISTLQTIASCLGVDIADIFDDGESSVENSDLDFIKDELAIEQGDELTNSGYSYHPLVKSFKHKYMSPFLMRINKGKTRYFEHDSEEFMYIVEGEIDLKYNGKLHNFKKGDSFYFDSRIPHQSINNSEETAVILSVNFNYRRF